MKPQDIATVETDLFNHREVKPNFINDCCFGEDFAAWLRGRISNLPGFEFSEPTRFVPREFLGNFFSDFLTFERYHG